VAMVPMFFRGLWRSITGQYANSSCAAERIIAPLRRRHLGLHPDARALYNL
jgi:hypothetical protein